MKKHKIKPKTLQKEIDHAKIKTFSAQFGNKIAQKLIKPINIVLNTK